jgi:hypothetical protein
MLNLLRQRKTEIPRFPHSSPGSRTVMSGGLEPPVCPLVT